MWTLGPNNPQKSPKSPISQFAFLRKRTDHFFLPLRHFSILLDNEIVHLFYERNFDLGLQKLHILNCAKVAFRKMRPFWAKMGVGGAIGFLGSKPNQKVGPPGIPFGSTIISKSCFLKFQLNTGCPTKKFPNVITSARNEIAK